MQSIITIFLVAIGLSMDAFSLSIVYGTLGFTKKRVIALSSIVGIFHFFMPLLGSAIGAVILHFIPVDQDLIVGVIFMVIAIQMIMSTCKSEEIMNIVGIGSLLLFGFTVSIDSFSVGIGLSAISNNHLLSVTIFSIISALFTFFGLIIGNKLNSVFGKISTWIGSIILIILSLIYMFN